MQSILICGNVGSSELKQTGNENILKFNVAVNEKYKNREGMQIERTDWFRCNLFGTRATGLASYITKGTKVLVRGRVRVDNYTNANGVKMTASEIHVDEIEFVGSSSKTTEEPALEQ